MNNLTMITKHNKKWKKYLLLLPVLLLLVIFIVGYVHTHAIFKATPMATISTSTLMVASVNLPATLVGSAQRVDTVSVSILAPTPAKAFPYTEMYGGANIPVVNGYWSFLIPSDKLAGWAQQYFYPMLVQVGYVNESGNLRVLATGTLDVVR